MLADYRDLVGDLVRDAVDRLGDEPRDRAIGLAVVQYGKDRPRTEVSDLAAVVTPGDPPLAHLPLPTGWATGVSAALVVEHPIGHVPPQVLPRHLWSQLATPTGTVIGLPVGVAAGAMHRLTWTRPHDVGEAVDTVPAADREAVAHYAAALLLDQLAAAASGDVTSTIRADAVDHGEAAPNYAQRARTARQRYHDLLGIDPRRQQPAAVTVHPPLANTLGGDRLLFRRRRG